MPVIDVVENKLFNLGNYVPKIPPLPQDFLPQFIISL